MVPITFQSQRQKFEMSVTSNLCGTREIIVKIRKQANKNKKKKKYIRRWINKIRKFDEWQVSRMTLQAFQIEKNEKKQIWRR